MIHRTDFGLGHLDNSWSWSYSKISRFQIKVYNTFIAIQIKI